MKLCMVEVKLKEVCGNTTIHSWFTNIKRKIKSFNRRFSAENYQILNRNHNHDNRKSTWHDDNSCGF